MSRILLINQYFPPDTAATATMAARVAEALAGRHEVTVLAGRPSYDPAERHRWYALRRERRGSVTAERVGSTAFSRRRMAGRAANYVSFLALAGLRALWLAGRADVVVAMTDPPVAGIMGAAVAALRGRPFVYNVRDLYPEVAVDGGLLPPGPWVAAWRRLHRWALRRAARVVVLGEDMRERVIASGADPARVVVVRDGIRVAASVPRDGEAVRREVRGKFRFVALHAGNLGFVGAWETLVRGAALLNGDGVGLVFVGDGVAAERMRTLAAAMGAPVRWLPFRPPEEVPHVLAAGDVHVVTVRRGLEGAVVPSKLYGILAAGRPVLVVAGERSDAARIVRRHRCGFVADPDRPEMVAEAIRAAMADPEALREMGLRAREAAAEFEQGAQLRRFVRAVEDVAAGRSG